MKVRTSALALAAGFAAFVLVGAAVTELLAPRIEFSVLVGLPAGLLAGVVATALVGFGLGQSPASRRFALTVGAFGVAFAPSLLAVAFVLDTGLLTAMAVAAFAGILAAGGTYWRVRGSKPASEEPERAGG